MSLDDHNFSDVDLQGPQNGYMHLWNAMGIEGDPEVTEYSNFDNIRQNVNNWAYLSYAQFPEEPAGQGQQDQPESMTLSGEDDSDTADSSHQSETESANLTDDGRICYGMIYEADVKLSETNMPKLNLKLENQAHVDGGQHILNFKVERKIDHIGLLFSDDVPLGILSSSMFDSLGPILESEPTLRLEGVARAQQLCRTVGKITKSSDRKIRLNINVYGLREKAKEIGDKLSNRKVWLQRPESYKTAFPYENPHLISFPGIEAVSASANEARIALNVEKAQDDEERMRKILSEVHNSLQRAGELEMTNGDRRLKTPLLDHQQRALTFMKQRESGNIPEKYRLWRKSSLDGEEMYIHQVTKTRSTILPEERGGGVLADEMGMGKSLCLLALLLETLDEGQKWAQERQNEEYRNSTVKRYSRSTLVVVPSALLINNWVKEIKTHLGGALKFIKYHGQGREKDLDVLSDSDVVITTYQTLASESAGKKSQLHRIGWYRVVLDEAHVIRRPATTFHRTCMELEARSRWCLTGTPIQNRLLDIGALFSFLRADQFHSTSQFRRFIVFPFEQGNPIVKDRLVLLYDSLCLRRTKDILNLPGIDERVRKLDFSPEEEKQYKSTLNILNRSIREKIGQYDKSNEFGLFQAHLQLRILCNHGTYQKPFSWKRNYYFRDANEALAVDLGTQEVRCLGCEQLGPVLGSSFTSSATDKCNHFFCSACLEDFEEISGPLDSMHCPKCIYGNAEIPLRTNSRPIHHSNQVANTNQRRGNNLNRSIYFNEKGCSVKMNALVQDVMQGLDEMKSIIFSCWTCTMDLIGHHLDEAKVDYLRIDGDTLMSKRQRLLDQFDGRSGARILLMTTGTGAFGLNIPAARRVFILEPQWNPSVENQAIARTTRLNQKEKVLVIRYLIKGTIEEEMQSQQKQKREIAKLGW
ncbi:hypothetical protein F5Y19DRAFT_469074 [Xylariaceae sp. FL1651]|nr:hypothetical protein F5Y19DRAFT_469074 [Xylariaceae sp. FL1651]